MTGNEIKAAILATLETQLRTTESGRAILGVVGELDRPGDNDAGDRILDNLLRNMAGNVAQIAIGWIEEAEEVATVRALHAPKRDDRGDERMSCGCDVGAHSPTNDSEH